jgi:restriction endonuclease S subunit
MQNTWTRFWPDIPLGNIASLSTACLYQLHDWPNDTFEPITIIQKIMGGKIVLSDIKYVRISERDMVKFELKKGDVVFNNRTSASHIGISALFDLDDQVLHTKYLRIRPCPELDSRFLQVVLQNYKTAGKLRNITKVSSGLSMITLSDLNRLRIPCPPLQIQREILDCIDPESENEKLDNLIQGHY